MTDCIQVLTTAGSEEEAARIARMLVDARLAACVQVLGPIASTYRWQGAIETSREWLMVDGQWSMWDTSGPISH